MNRRLTLLALLAAPLAALAALAQAQTPAPATPGALDFFAGQGCAIGPATLAAADRAGLDKAAVEALTATAAAHPDTVRTGDWLVMPPDLCRMRLPDITSEVSLTDPEVVASITPIDAYEADGGRGCFLQMEALMEALEAGRGWDSQRAYMAYMRLVAAGLISGEMTFFSTEPLVTPWGFQLVTGQCGAELADIALIREDHAHLAAQFDEIIRASAADTECIEGASGNFYMLEQPAPTRNAWTNFQAMAIVLGAGWQEGLSLTEKGTPRPPLCHYPTAD